MKSSDEDESISPGLLYGFISHLMSYRELKMHNFRVNILAEMFYP